MGDNTASDQEIQEARERMLEGKETPWLDRKAHRGESPHVEGQESADPTGQSSGISAIDDGAGISAGGNFGTSGSHQGSTTPRGHGGASSGGSHANHGDNIEGAFGQQQGGPDAVRPGTNTRDNAIDKNLELEAKEGEWA